MSEHHEGRRFPAERSSRREGWTEGPSLMLADDKPWRLPAIDDGLIPYLGRLVPIAESVSEFLGIMDDAKGRGDEPGVASAGTMAETYLLMLLLDLLSIQYRNRRSTLRRLLRIDPATSDAAWAVIDSYRAALARFVIRRYPIGFRAAELVVKFN